MLSAPGNTAIYNAVYAGKRLDASQRVNLFPVLISEAPGIALNYNF
jgi:hypothetical protein